MKVYLVGGAVRDQLRGVPPRDHDYVVVESSAAELVALGFQQVGTNIPVFIHPETRDEYTLAEGGIEDDLARRDLTINAMAMDQDGKLIDPFGGKKDLELRILKHVSARFAEDPLRVLRVARFKAHNPDFQIATETLLLIQQISTTAGYCQLAGERVFNELREALKAPRPSIFFEVLKDAQGLAPYFLELRALIGVPQVAKYHPEGDCWIHTMMVLDQAAKMTDDLIVRFSALVHDLGKGITPANVLPRHIGHEKAGLALVQKFAQRLFIPNDWLEAALMVTRFHLKIHRIKEMKANTIVQMFYEIDAFRKPWLIDILALACEADEMGKLKTEVHEGKLLKDYYLMVSKVSAADVKTVHQGKDLGVEIRAERIRKLARAMKLPDNI
jgi:tRNA nucleotidyltransferase (CCA-adding enzyme)